MWLLSTDRAELHYFQNNYDATGGYAILSHTWTGDEQTLQEVRDIIKRCHAEGTNPRDYSALSEKIRQSCIIAEKYGYRWVWIDSCCIDKTSSSEVSDAIGAMFTWYQQAEVCFAYLADVLSDCELRKPGSTFRESRWHTRGWALQDLIAPDFLIFLSVDWHELGNRADLAGLLREITGIPTGILTGENQPAHYSVCTRMSWASRRKTTRVEDEAYCLFGLFSVFTRTDYGEGRLAFIRLQHELMQRDPDLSLFTFGGYIYQDHSFQVTFLPDVVPANNWRYLLADSPREFNSSAVYLPDVGTKVKQPYPPLTSDLELTGPFEGGIELPRVALASYGIKLRVPVIEVDGITIAVTLCQRNGRNIGLFLTRDIQAKDPRRTRYFTGCVFTKPDTGAAQFIARLADLGDDLYNLSFNGKVVKASWRTVYVVHTPSDFDSTPPKLLINCDPSSPFRFPRWLITRLTALEFIVTQRRVTNTQLLHIFREGVVHLYITFGSCAQCEDGSPYEPPVLWAKVDVLLSYMRVDTFTHECSEDHLNSESWGTRSKAFGDADRGVRLSLIPSTRMPDSYESFIIHLELFGRVLREQLKEAGGLYMFPSIMDLERGTLRSRQKDAVSSSLSPMSRPQAKPASSSNLQAIVGHSGSQALPLHSSVSSTPPPPTAALSSSSASTSSSHIRSSRVSRPAPKSLPDTHARKSPQGSNCGQHQPERGDKQVGRARTLIRGAVSAVNHWFSSAAGDLRNKQRKLGSRARGGALANTDG